MSSVPGAAPDAETSLHGYAQRESNRKTNATSRNPARALIGFFVMPKPAPSWLDSYLSLPISREHYYAIGHVAAMWNAVETEIRRRVFTTNVTLLFTQMGH